MSLHQDFNWAKLFSTHWKNLLWEKLHYLISFRLRGAWICIKVTFLKNMLSKSNAILVKYLKEYCASTRTYWICFLFEMLFKSQYSSYVIWFTLFIAIGHQDHLNHTSLFIHLLLATFLGIGSSYFSQLFHEGFFFSKRKTNQNGNKMVKICSKSGFSRNLFIRFSWFFYVKSSNLLCWNFRSILDKKSGLTWLCPKNDYESLRFFLKESFCCGFNQN